MITNLILSLGLSFAVGINGIKENNNNYVKDNPTNVVYNDTNYQITLSVNELNNYTWNNLKSYINEFSTSVNSVVIGTNWVYGEYSNTSVSVSIDNGTRQFNLITFAQRAGSGPVVSIDFNYQNQAIFYNYLTDENKMDNDLSITLNETYYNDFKNAIQLDIQANEVEPASMGNSIISAIVSGLGLISDLASEFLTGFSTLFWNANNSTLTSFGTFALVMLGVAITMAVISLVLNLIRGNTGA